MARADQHSSFKKNSVKLGKTGKKDTDTTNRDGITEEDN